MTLAKELLWAIRPTLAATTIYLALIHTLAQEMPLTLFV